MSANSKKYDVSKLPSHSRCKAMQGDFKFELFEYYKHKSINTINATCLVIGFELSVKVDKEDQYIVVENKEFNQHTSKDNIIVHYVPKAVFESMFEKTKRPSNGILKEPVVGDSVVCIAKLRYQGVSAGKAYTVRSLPLGRVNVNGGEYTYESQYFVVVGEKFEFDLDIDEGRKLPKKKVEVFDGMAAYGSVASAMSYNTREDFEKLLDDEELEKREILDSGGLIERKELEEEVLEKRVIYKPKTIVRKVIN